MNKGMKHFLEDVAQSTGLKIDEHTGALYGNQNGYCVIMTQINQTRQLSLSVSVCQGGEAPNAKTLKEALKTSKALKSCIVQRYKVSYSIRSGMTAQKTVAYAQEALAAVTAFLRENRFSNCCQSCGEPVETAAYNVAGVGALILCPDCFADSSNAAEQRLQSENRKGENVVGGIVGALLGSLIGAAVIILLGQLGYVAALSGVVIAVCTLKGYELLGGRLSNKGIVIGVLLMALMSYIGYRTDWAITAAQYFEVDVFTAFRIIPRLVAEEYIETGVYYTNLALVYLFAALGAVPTVIGAVRARRQSAPTCKMSAGI